MFVKLNYGQRAGQVQEVKFALGRELIAAGRAEQFVPGEVEKLPITEPPKPDPPKAQPQSKKKHKK
jgi:hypothetical protein